MIKIGPQAVNAGTTYGVDGSASNNFGLGPAYRNANVKGQAITAKAAAPSWFWLAAIVALGVIFL